MQTKFSGRVWKFGDDISTDHIIAGRYLTSTDPKVLAEHAMENVDPQFVKKVKPGDLVVAATNFGCGSSREQAPIALKAAGISCIVANTFARIFYRNSINIGFPVVECPGLHNRVKDGDTITVDLASGHVVLPAGERIPFQPMPPNILEILNAGGLVPKLRADLAAKSA
ncbi:MAG TPA: 3-isopropylmalate dehydratase small subunit [Thermoplasmata archaeon]|nr:3-isopropylmalate dehydratase small subunit [Thermoplasmata archaeon]